MQPYDTTDGTTDQASNQASDPAMSPAANQTNEERRRQGQVFGTADELRVLRTLNARANAMRRMAGNKNTRQAMRLTKAKSGSRVA